MTLMKRLPIETGRTLHNGSDRFESVLERLGRPFARGERYALYQGDSLELLRHVPKSTADLAFTSPPYNIGKEYEKVLPLESYLDWCARWIGELFRIATPSGAFVLNVGYVALEGRARSVPIPYLLWDKVPFFLQQEIVWNYGAGVAARKALSPRNEKLLWYVRDSENYCFNLDEIRDPDVAYPNQRKNGKLRCNTLGKNPSDVWQIAKVTSGTNRASVERTKHPAQFPLDLCARVIKGFSNPGEVVLDPFAGSGSSLESAASLNRFALGFELRKDYCRMAADRLKAATAARPLF